LKPTYIKKYTQPAFTRFINLDEALKSKPAIGKALYNYCIVPISQPEFTRGSFTYWNGLNFNSKKSDLG
jgi:hypothetical protein